MSKKTSKDYLVDFAKIVSRVDKVVDSHQLAFLQTTASNILKQAHRIPNFNQNVRDTEDQTFLIRTVEGKLDQIAKFLIRMQTLRYEIILGKLLFIKLLTL